MRIGNAVGKKPFSNTNRKGVKFSRRLNRKARAHGFASHKAFVGHIGAMLNLQKVVKE